MKTLVYLLQVSTCTGVFYLFYYLALSRLTFFNLNRWYLLASLLLSFLIPSIRIPETRVPLNYPVTQFNISTAIEEYSQSQVSFAETPVINTFDWLRWLPALYILGLIILSLYFIASIIKLFRKIQRQEVLKSGNISLIRGSDFKNGSFLNYIFINEEQLTSEELEKVIEHELVHIAQMHSIDKIIARIVQIILWFNPFAYVYLNAIEANHEYQVDRKMAEGRDKEAYASLLLRLATSTNPLYHHFSRFPLSKRIALLFNEPSKNRKKLFYILIVPLILVSCVFFADREQGNMPTAKSPEKVKVSSIYSGIPSISVNNQWFRYKNYKEVKKRIPVPSGSEIKKQRREYEAWSKTPHGLKLKASIQKLGKEHWPVLTASIQGKYTADSKGPDYLKKGFLIRANNETYILLNYKQLPEDLLKVNDKIKIVVGSRGYSMHSPYVHISANSITRDNKIIYQEPAPAVFVEERNKVKYTEGVIVNIAQLGNEKYEMMLKRDVATNNPDGSVLNYTLNFLVKLNPSQIDFQSLSKFKIGEYVYLRCINEKKRNSKYYEISDWLSLSRYRGHGVINESLFYRFYERPRSNILDSLWHYSATDSIRYDKRNNKIYLYGGSDVSTDKFKLNARNVVVDKSNKTVKAYSDVSLFMRSSEQHLNADSIVLHYETGNFKAFGASGRKKSSINNRLIH